MDKRIDLDRAAAMVPSRCLLALGGVTLYRRPMAFVRALLRRFRAEGVPTDLTLLSFTAGIESDLLVGAGLAARVRSCYFGLEIFGLAPMFTYLGGRGGVEVVEETESSITFGLRAQMAGVGFMPARGWLGTDLPRLRPDVRTVRDPYSGEELMAFPAIRPDVTVIHALRADPEGNLDIGGNKGIDEELAVTSALRIATAEQIVPALERADITAPFTDWVVEAPGGALPTSCHPVYPLDGRAILAYTEQVSDTASFEQFLSTWLEKS
jgi:glutaconate CoA-transferase subunit A